MKSQETLGLPFIQMIKQILQVSYL